MCSCVQSTVHVYNDDLSLWHNIVEKARETALTMPDGSVIVNRFAFDCPCSDTYLGCAFGSLTGYTPLTAILTMLALLVTWLVFGVLWRRKPLIALAIAALWSACFIMKFALEYRGGLETIQGHPDPNPEWSAQLSDFLWHAPLQLIFNLIALILVPALLVYAVKQAAVWSLGKVRPRPPIESGEAP